jgi:hypothetical protein
MLWDFVFRKKKKMQCVICSKVSKKVLAKVNSCEHRFCDERIDEHINDSQECPKCDSLIRIVIYSDGNYCNLEDDEEEEEEEKEEEEEEEGWMNKRKLLENKIT